MKRPEKILLAILIAASFSCTETYDDSFVLADMDYSEPSVSEDKLLFEVVESSGLYSGPKTIRVISDNTQWQFIDYPDWLFIRPAKGSTTADVGIMAKDFNFSGKQREAEFRLVSQCGTISISKYITVVQKRVSTLNYISPEEFTVDRNEHSMVLALRTSGSWKLSCTAGWVHLQSENGPDGINNVKFTVDANETGAAREASILYESNDCTKSIKISQEK